MEEIRKSTCYGALSPWDIQEDSDCSRTLDKPPHYIKSVFTPSPSLHSNTIQVKQNANSKPNGRSGQSLHVRSSKQNSECRILKAGTNNLFLSRQVAVIRCRDQARKLLPYEKAMCEKVMCSPSLIKRCYRQDKMLPKVKMSIYNRREMGEAKQRLKLPKIEICWL